MIMAEVTPEPWLPSGYDDEFVEPVNGSLQSGICRWPMKDPRITRCGHHFCQGCIEKQLRRYCNLCRDRSRMVFFVILIVNSYSPTFLYFTVLIIASFRHCISFVKRIFMFSAIELAILMHFLSQFITTS